MVKRPLAPPGPGDLRCECGHLVTAHDVDRGCLLCECDRLSGLHRTLIARPEDGAALPLPVRVQTYEKEIGGERWIVGGLLDRIPE